MTEVKAKKCIIRLSEKGWFFDNHTFDSATGKCVRCPFEISPTLYQKVLQNKMKHREAVRHNG